MVDVLHQPTAPPDVQSAPDSHSLGLRIEAGFRRAVIQAIHHAHDAGRPVSYLDDSGRIVWLASDGKTYPSREAAQARGAG